MEVLLLASNQAKDLALVAERVVCLPFMRESKQEHAQTRGGEIDLFSPNCRRRPSRPAASEESPSALTRNIQTCHFDEGCEGVGHERTSATAGELSSRAPLAALAERPTTVRKACQ